MGRSVAIDLQINRCTPTDFLLYSTKLWTSHKNSSQETLVLSLPTLSGRYPNHHCRIGFNFKFRVITLRPCIYPLVAIETNLLRASSPPSINFLIHHLLTYLSTTKSSPPSADNERRNNPRFIIKKWQSQWILIRTACRDRPRPRKASRKVVSIGIK